MKNDGTSNPYMRWSAIVYIAYGVIFIVNFILRLRFEMMTRIGYLPDLWLTAWSLEIVVINAAIFVFLGISLLVTSVYARSLFKGRSAVGFAAWILSMMISPCHAGMFYYADIFFFRFRFGVADFFMIFEALPILPVALSAFSAKSRYTIPQTLLLYALCSIVFIFMLGALAYLGA